MEKDYTLDELKKAQAETERQIEKHQRIVKHEERIIRELKNRHFKLGEMIYTKKKHPEPVEYNGVNNPDAALYQLWASHRAYGEPIPRVWGYTYNNYDTLIADGIAYRSRYRGMDCIFLTERGKAKAALMFPHVKMGT